VTLAAPAPRDYTAPEEEAMKRRTAIGALLLCIAAYRR
jgi:hypothetical protein